jgi:hypothetical protein
MTTNRERLRHVFSLDAEMERGVALLERGIAAQRAFHIGESPRFLILIDLAGGLERMLKIAWALARLQSGAGWPSAREMQRASHGILGLLDAVAGLYPAEFLRIPDARWARDFLSTDLFFRQGVTILNDFAQQGRYYHVDLLGGRETDEQSPEQRWAAFEQEIGQRVFPDVSDRYRPLVNSDTDLYHTPVNAEVARLFEQFGYAMFRLLASGLPDTEARAWSVKWDRLLTGRPALDSLRAYLPDPTLTP